MATRPEIAANKAALLRDLRASHQAGARAGAAIKQRELSDRYGLSLRTISLSLAELVEEGVLYTVPRVGTFMGRPPAETVAPYLFVARHAITPQQPHGVHMQLQIGFEDRIAGLGGACLSLMKAEAAWHMEQGQLPRLSGVFEVDLGEVGQQYNAAGVPVVAYEGPAAPDTTIDSVDFDNRDGGAQATRHLLTMGHRNIAFLGLHHPSRPLQFAWSLEREAGWQAVMQQAGRASEGLSFCPSSPVQRPDRDQVYAAASAAASCLKKPEISAVVAVNRFAAEGLLQSLRDANVPAAAWPALVCFDAAPEAGASVISFLRLPWDKVGAEAAQLLWERQTGRLQGPAQKKLVEMRLIPRLSCRADWATASGLAQVRANGTGAAWPLAAAQGDIATEYLAEQGAPTRVSNSKP